MYHKIFAKCKTLKELYYRFENLKRDPRVDVTRPDVMLAYKNRFHELKKGASSG